MNTTWRSALDEVERELVEREEDLRVQQTKLTDLQQGVARLKDAQRALQALLQDPVESLIDPDALSVHNGAVVTQTKQDTQVGSVAESETVTVIPKSTNATINHIVDVLQISTRPLRAVEVETAMHERGWIDPDWKDPSGAVYAALRRGRDAGLVNRYGRRWGAVGVRYESEREIFSEVE